MLTCNICGATEEDNRIINSKKYGKILCRRHYLQLSRYGKTYTRTIYDNNEIIEHEDYAEILLYDKLGNIKSSTYIDLDSVNKCSGIKWYQRSSGYVYGSINKNTKIQLHRYLFTEDLDGYEVDHIDGNPLNNKLCNLRVATHKQNSRNIHKDTIVGVNYNKWNGKYYWIPRIMVDGKSIWLGVYNTKEEAIAVRLDAEHKYFGEFSPTSSQYRKGK